MARRNNNRLNTSWFTKYTGASVPPMPPYYWNRRGPRVNQMEGSPSADESKWLLGDFTIYDDSFLLEPIPIAGFTIMWRQPPACEDLPLPAVPMVEDEGQPALHALIRTTRKRQFVFDVELPQSATIVEDESRLPPRMLVRSTRQRLPPVDQQEFRTPINEESAAPGAQKLVARRPTLRPIDGEASLPFVIAEQDGLPLRKSVVRHLVAPVSFGTGSEEAAFPVSEETTSPLRKNIGRRLVALVPPASEETVDHVSDEESGPRAGHLPARLRPQRPAGGGDEMAFPVSEEDGSRPRSKVRGPLKTLFPQDSGDFVPPVLDDDAVPGRRPRVRGLLRLVPPHGGTADFVPPVLDDDAVPGRRPRVGRLLKLVPAHGGTADFVPAVVEDDGAPGRRPHVKGLHKLVPPHGGTAEFVPPAVDDEAVLGRRPHVRGLTKLTPPHGGTTEFVPPMVDEDGTLGRRPHLRIVYRAPRPIDTDDGLPSGGPPPPPPKPPFVPTIGQTGDQSAPGGGGEIPSPSDFEPHDEHTIEPEDVDEAEAAAPTIVGLVAPAPELPVIDAEIVESEAANFAAVATSLAIFVRATILHVEPVERGNLVYFIAPFTGQPDEVFFSYVAPGSPTPVVDAGFGQVDSNIKRVKPQTLLQLGYAPLAGWTYYICTVDTSGMRGGKLVAHFWGTGKFQASGFVEVEIKDRPRQLL